MSKSILVLNAGSSSIKFAIFQIPATATEDLTLVRKGHVAQMATRVELRVDDAQGNRLAQLYTDLPAGLNSGFDHAGAIEQLLAWVDSHPNPYDIAAVGHRVVHGGGRYTGPVPIDKEVLANLAALVALAPLHQPHNLHLIKLLAERRPGIPQVACFDTAFHCSQPAVAQASALPNAITERGVKRYGFHGLSYEYIASQLPKYLGQQAMGRVIVAHLGNGASLCGLLAGKSHATSMGFSALDGLVMGTRCGALDPGAVLYLLQEMQMSPAEVSHMLYQDSGLLGVSGISSDMQALLSSAEPLAAQAIELFVYRVVCGIGALAAALGGLDALVFTAGIGEHAPAIRGRIVQGCAWLGAELDPAANHSGQVVLHSANSQLNILVIPTDEERDIAQHSLAILKGDLPGDTE